jgi:hypothetical protein
VKPTSKRPYLFLIGLGVFASAALAPTPGTFAATGNMTTPRSDHTATLLTNGKVLIAGGSLDGSTRLVSAELYDPSTQTFIATGNMTTGRSIHTATLLPDGRVLIIGGDNDMGSAELYDPATGTFTATGSMSIPRTEHAAALLADGRVLVAGGFHSDGSSEVSAELYDACPSPKVRRATESETSPCDTTSSSCSDSSSIW